MDGNEEKILLFEKHRQALYRQLANLEAGKIEKLDPSHKSAIESLLRPVICRTERTQISTDFLLLSHLVNMLSDLVVKTKNISSTTVLEKLIQ